MNKKIIVIVIVVIIIAIISFVLILKNNKDVVEDKKEMNSNQIVKININEKDYVLTLEDNDTTRKLVSMLPLELDMEELNGNEKYYYLDDTLPTNSKNPGKILKGDVMLYQNNCLVIFYKSFNTSYSYTKIGHIDNLPDLGSDNIKVIFTK